MRELSRWQFFCQNDNSFCGDACSWWINCFCNANTNILCSLCFYFLKEGNGRTREKLVFTYVSHCFCYNYSIVLKTIQYDEVRQLRFREMSLKIKMSIICFHWANSKGVSTTYNCWLNDYTFSLPRVRLRFDYAIIPEAFYDCCRNTITWLYQHQPWLKYESCCSTTNFRSVVLLIYNNNYYY